MLTTVFAGSSNGSDDVGSNNDKWWCGWLVMRVVGDEGSWWCGSWWGWQRRTADGQQWQLISIKCFYLVFLWISCWVGRCCNYVLTYLYTQAVAPFASRVCQSKVCVQLRNCVWRHLSSRLLNICKNISPSICIFEESWFFLRSSDDLEDIYIVYKIITVDPDLISQASVISTESKKKWGNNTYIKLFKIITKLSKCSQMLPKNLYPRFTEFMDRYICKPIY